MMKRIGTVLVALCATVLSAASSPRPAEVEYSHRGIVGGEVVQYNEECLVAPSLLERFGWRTTKQEGRVRVEAEGRTFYLESRQLEGRAWVSLTEAARFVGATARWEGERYRVLGQLRTWEMTPQGLRLDVTLGVNPRVSRLSQPDRLVVDLRGAHLHPAATEGLPESVRMGQFQPDVVRVVWEHPSVATMELPRLTAGRSFLLPVTAAAPEAPVEGLPEFLDRKRADAHIQDGPPEVVHPPPTAPIAPLAILSRPRLASETEDEVKLLLPFTGIGVTRAAARFDGDHRIVLMVAGARPSQLGEVTSPVPDLVESVQMLQDEEGTSVVLNLKQPLVFESSIDEVGVRLRLSKNPIADRRVRGRVITVDPGHGGRDPGAVWGTVLEKDIVLAVGRNLSRELQRMGFSVVMTRSDDRFVTLLDRAAIANRAGSHLFVSVHCNSNQNADSVSGFITFFHRQSTVGQAFGRRVHESMRRVSPIRSIGVWSDTRIHSIGFSVLRNTRMPGLLLELGFINHHFDRGHMTRTTYQQSIALAVAQGVRDFVIHGN